MALKKKIAKLEEVAENLRSMYTPVADGSFVLDLDGEEDEIVDMRKKLKEFRDNNIQLTKARDELTTKLGTYKDIDPAKYKQAQDALAELDKYEEGALIKEGKLEEVVARRMSTAKNSWDEKERAYQKRQEALEREAKDVSGKYKKLRVETEVGRHLSAMATIRPGAIDDVLGRARGVWDVNEKDELVIKDQFNEAGQPMTMDEWGKHLIKSAGHLFEPGSGGGASGGHKQQKNEAGRQVIQPDGNGVMRLDSAQIKAVASGKAKVLQPAGGNDD